jgi:hypothetical protein
MIISFNQHCFALGFDHQTRSSIRFQWSSWRRIHMPIDNSRRIGRPGRRPTLQNKASQSFSLSTTSTDRVPEVHAPPLGSPVGPYGLPNRHSIRSQASGPCLFICQSQSIAVGLVVSSLLSTTINSKRWFS